ncbi:MAG: baseplate J/gp47 family protein [Candidatus Hodarchaeota archaeon]
MAKTRTVDNRQVIDYMARDYESFKQAMISLIPSKLSNWTDRSEADFGIVLIEIFAHMADILSYYQDRVANESFLATAKERRSVIQHLRLIGYELEPAAAASGELSLIVSNDKTDAVQINKGDQFATKSSETEKSIRFEYVSQSPLEIDLSTLVPDTAGTGFKKFVGIPVKEGQIIKDEILGVSDGKPNQFFQLAQAKSLRDSLQLKVQIGGRIEDWLLRKNLIYSRPMDHHYSIQIDENDITHIYFGDGVNGRIPEKDAQIVSTYRVGGGVRGNVAKDRITVISNAPQLQALAARVTNEKPATGGAEREPIEHAVKFAPTVFKSLQRGVTMEDYVALAKQFPGVAKAKSQAVNWNYVDLYIAPSGGGLATDLLKSELLGYFEDLRMMTALIRIKDPTYVPIYITAEVNVKSYYFQTDVQHQIEDAIRTKVLNFDELDFGQPVYLSKVYEAIEAVEGVDFVNVSEFLRDNSAIIYRSTDSNYDMDLAIEAQGIIEIKKYEIPCKGHPNNIRTVMTGGY